MKKLTKREQAALAKEAWSKDAIQLELQHIKDMRERIDNLKSRIALGRKNIKFYRECIKKKEYYW